MARAQQAQIIGDDWYIYESHIPALSFGAAGNATDTINIQANSDFILYQTVYAAFIGDGPATDGARVLPLVTLQLTDTGSGQQLFSDNVPIINCFGTAQRPYILPSPRRFRANTTLTINYNNFSAATTYDIYLGFAGKKVFRD